MYAPIFIKGDVKLLLEDRSVEFLNQNISLFGLSGLPWGTLNPVEHFGKTIPAEFKLAGLLEPLVIPVTLLREETAVDDHLALKFHWTPEAQAMFEVELKSRGFYPTEYLRKYPRLPAQATIRSFPLRAQVSIDRPKPGQQVFAPAVFDVSNLSPNGILLSTENPLAKLVVPGTRLKIILDPRGWFPLSVRIIGQVCRITDDLNPENGNVIRHFGIKFVQVDPLQKKAFLDLIRDILIQFKAEMTAAEVGQKPTESV